jgi:hypothetical protein
MGNEMKFEDKRRRKYYLILISLLMSTGVLIIINEDLEAQESSIAIDEIRFKETEYSSVLQTGTFSVSNTPNLTYIFHLNYIPRIGQTWNITFKLDSNSTTSVKYKAKYGRGMWEGPEEFNSSIGENITHQYISHVCGDNYGTLWIYFYIRLHNISASASGSYSANLLFGGYTNPEGCNTGRVIIDDIEKWVNPPPTPPHPLVTIGIGTLTVIFLYYYRKKYF